MGSNHGIIIKPFKGIELRDGLALAQLSPSDTPELWPIIETERLELREYLGWVDYVPDMFTLRKLFEMSALKHLKSGSMHLVLRLDGEVAGTLNHNKIDWSTKSATLGYWLSMRFRRRGLMETALRYFIDYSYNELGLREMQILCATENLRSRRLPEKLCFSHVGQIPRGEFTSGRYLDLEVYKQQKESQ